MAIAVKFATILAEGGPSSDMDRTDEAVRMQVRRLVKLGLSQKVLATYIGENEAWVSRWLNQKGTTKAPVINADHMDRLSTYFAELLDAIEAAPPHVTNAVTLLQVAKRITPPQRALAIETLNEIIQRQETRDEDGERLSSSAARNTRPDQETQRAPKGSSAGKAAATVRRRPA